MTAFNPIFLSVLQFTSCSHLRPQFHRGLAIMLRFLFTFISFCEQCSPTHKLKSFIKKFAKKEPEVYHENWKKIQVEVLWLHMYVAETISCTLLCILLSIYGIYFWFGKFAVDCLGENVCPRGEMCFFCFLDTKKLVNFCSNWLRALLANIHK